MDGGAWWAAVPGVAVSRTWLSGFAFTFHFHSLEKEMATYSSIAWRIPGMGEPGGLRSMGSHRIRHDRSDLAAAAFWICLIFSRCRLTCFSRYQLSLASLYKLKVRSGIISIWTFLARIQVLLLCTSYMWCKETHNEMSGFSTLVLLSLIIWLTWWLPEISLVKTPPFFFFPPCS